MAPGFGTTSTFLGGVEQATPALPFDLADSKLHPPTIRPGIVARADLVERLTAAGTMPVISVVAPPGYGKTTLLAQWAERTPVRVGWVSADVEDNDPTVLLTYIAVALHRLEGIDPAVFRSILSPGADIKGPRRLAEAMAAMDEPVSLVLDHLEAVTNRESLDAIAALALGLPAGSQIAIGSRDVLPLPAARLRSQGGLVEIGVDDLSMGHPEATSLLGAAGAEVSEADVAELVKRTEGWPVGLYLAALAIKAGGQSAEIGATFTGDDRFMGDYLRSEFLDRLSRADVLFLTRTSILDRLCGPLCDAVTGGKRSANVLERLESRNLLVVPLDRRREWFRYHQLFRDLLSSELRRREPANVAELHLRAATWCEDNGQPEAAIAHAQAAGDADRVARLVLQQANPVWASGRGATVMRWMEWFEANGLLERFPAIAVHGALMYALAGRPAATEQWAAAAERTSTTGTLADGNTIEGTLAYLRALLCRDGVEVMRRDAQEGVGRTCPGESVPNHDAPCRRPLPPPRRRSRPSGCPPRSCRCRRRSGGQSSRHSPSCLPSEASWRSSARTGPRPPRSPRRHWRSSVTVSSTTIGRVPWCTPGQHELRCIAVMLHRADSSSRWPPVCDRC